MHAITDADRISAELLHRMILPSEASAVIEQRRTFLLCGAPFLLA